MSATDLPRSRTLLALVMTMIVVTLTGVLVGALAPGATLGSTADESATHTDPATVGSERDLGALERQMADQLASRARSGSLNLSREDAQNAREALNDSQYESLLNRYADVANETGQVNRSLAFRRVRSDQLRLTTAVDQYWAIYGQYLSARNGTLLDRPLHSQWGGDAISARLERALARQLEAKWRTITTSRVDLVTSQRGLAALTDDDITRTLDSVNASVETVNATQQEVRDEQFVRTTLSVATDDERISFRDPLVVRGRLVTETGSAVADERVRFAVGNQTIWTRTDGDGQFELRYRPTTIAVNTTNVSIRYRPSNQSTYLGDTRTVPVSITAVEPPLSVDVLPAQTSYNDTIRVAGLVGTADASVPNVSYLVSVDRRVLAVNTTTRNGTFDRTLSVPATVDDGERTVRVSVPFDRQALRSTNESTVLTVSQTATSVDASVTQLDGRTVRVAGTLSTVNGDPIRDQQLTVRANGTVLGTVSTGPNGTFDTELTVPGNVGTAGPLDSTVSLAFDFRFDGATTNLQGSRMQTTVVLSTPPLGLWVGGVLGLLLLLGGGVVVGRRFFDDSVGSTPGAVDHPDTPTLQTHDTVSTLDTATLLDIARERLDEGSAEMAARIGYLALRQQLSEPGQMASGQTPWEFYHARTDESLDQTATSTLQRATGLYERVRFDDTGESVSVGDVEDLLNSVGSLIANAGTTD